MSKLSDLKKRAVAWARVSHHELGKWTDFKPAWGGDASNAHCIYCSRWVQVVTEPPPNGIDIAGSIATNCTGGPKDG